MNILFVISSLAKQAPVRLLLDIAKGMQQKNHEVQVLTLNREKKNSMIDEFIASGINLHCLNESKLSCELFTQYVCRKVQNYIADHDIDLVHCSCYNSTVVCAKLEGVKKTLTFHNYCTDHIISRGRLMGSYMVFRFLKSASNYDVPIAISQDMQQFYQKRFRGTMVQCVYNGVNTEKFVPVGIEKVKDKLKEELGLPQKKIYLVCGSLCKRKNPLPIVRAFNSAKLENAVLVFIGDGELLNEAKSVANENIIFKGFVSNAAEYFSASDVLISASLSEGLPLNSLEALSAGMGLILSNIKAHKEIAELCACEFIRLFSLDDEDVLRQELRNLNDTNYFLHYEEIRQKAIVLFSREVMVENYERLFVGRGVVN
ncbi:MAG: glycosyltransferase family 4 protein [Bacteroidales bacterium]